MTSKYDPLKRHLLQSGGEPIHISFSDIEQLIGYHLPTAARTNDSWWLDRSPNKHRAHAKAWLDMGRQIISVDRVGEMVTFTSVRDRKEPILLEDVAFPVEKIALLERALHIGVPDPIREALERLPQTAFRSRSEFVVAVERMASG
jgi:hypothetical protein